MISNRFKRKNVPPDYLKAKKAAKKTGEIVPEPEGLDWAYIFDNNKLCEITKTTNTTSFCRIQYLKYIAHVTRLNNDSLQKQLLFSIDHKKFSRDPWIKTEKRTKHQQVANSKKLCKIKMSSCLYSTILTNRGTRRTLCVHEKNDDED